MRWLQWGSLNELVSMIQSQWYNKRADQCQTQINFKLTLFLIFFWATCDGCHNILLLAKITLILRNPQNAQKCAWGTKHHFSHVCLSPNIWWVKTILFLVVTSQFNLVFESYKIQQFWLQNQMQNIIFHFYYFGNVFWNVNQKDLSSFAQWT